MAARADDGVKSLFSNTHLADEEGGEKTKTLLLYRPLLPPSYQILNHLSKSTRGALHSTPVALNQVRQKCFPSGRRITSFHANFLACKIYLSGKLRTGLPDFE
jgi:hypothetical protein